MVNSKSITIMDIAKSAGVSKTTVSRYLNGKYEFMSEDTRQRIATVIGLTGYRPNSIARSLKSQKSMLIGLLVADIESPFSSAIIKSVGDTMIRKGYNLITANSNNNSELEADYLHSLVNQKVDGLLVNAVKRQNPLLLKLANDGLPVVLIDRFIDDDKLDTVYLQNKQPVYTAVGHLYQQNYGRIAFFVQPYEDVSPRYLRRDAFVDMLKRHGVKHPERLVYEVDLTSHSHIKSSVQALLRDSKGDGKSPAIIAGNGVTLMHTAQAILSLNLAMPREIGLCGYDDWGRVSDLGWAGMIGPGLTTLTPSLHELGEAASSILLQRLASAEMPKQEIGIDVPLVVRGSTLNI